MNSTPASARRAQKRSSGLAAGVSTNLLDPQRGLASTLTATGALGGVQLHVGSDQRQIDPALVVLTLFRAGTWIPGFAVRGRIATTVHSKHSTSPSCLE